jgi:glycosyltransferase involved in cell wall biosynthesis
MNAIGIRSYEFAKVLATHCDVTVATSRATNAVDEDFQMVVYRTKRELSRLLKANDVLVSMGINPPQFPLIVRSGIRWVWDIYTPLAFEVLERYPSIDEKLLTLIHKRDASWAHTQMLAADFMLCPNEKVMDFWLGVMNAIGKLTPTSYLQDMSTRKLIDVVPYGLPSQPPKHTKRVIKGVIPGIDENDTVLLWNSAIPGWLDPATLIYAMEKLWRKREDIKLLFFGLGDISAEGVKGPHKHVWARAREAVALSQELGLVDKNIIFMFNRVPYHDVQNFLLEADIGVSTYPDSLETRLCLGSRLLDFVWARVPLVTSKGDLLCGFVDKSGIGLTAECGNADDLAAAILKLVEERALYARCKENLAKFAPNLTWEKLAQPLLHYCENWQDYPTVKKGNALQYAVGLARFVYYTALVKWQARK